MLKELVEIGKYSSKQNSEVENYVQFQSGEFFVFQVLYDGEKFVFEEIIKSGDKNDIIGMCFKPGKARSISILPNAYLTLVDGEVSGLDKIESSLKNLEKEFGVLKTVSKAFEKFSKDEEFLEKLKEKLKDIPLKDKNKKIITNILSLKLSSNYTKSLGLTPTQAQENYFGQIKEFENYFLSKNSGEGAILIDGFCHVCQKQKNNIIDFKKSSGVNFDYKFYNLDKPGFAYGLEENNGIKSFGVCKDCYGDIKSGYNFFKNNLSNNILGMRGFIITSSEFFDNEKIFFLLEKYNNKNLNQLEKQTQYEISNKNSEIPQLIDIFGDEEEKQTFSNPLVKFIILFGAIDGAKSDEFKIKYSLKDILGSRLAKIYETILPFQNTNPNNILPHLKQNLFGDFKTQKFFDSLGDLYLFPTYQKNEYNFNIKNFLSDFSSEKNYNEKYLKFLDRYLHFEQFPPGEIWEIIQKKLSQSFKDFKIGKIKNLKLGYDLWESYLILNYMIENKMIENILDEKLKMKDFVFDTENEGMKRLQEYISSQSLFDTPQKVYVALVGLYVMMCIKKQFQEIKSNPFMSYINFDRMDMDHIDSLLTKARDKFNKYSDKKFAYYPELYKQILSLKMNLDNKKIEKEKLPFYFSIGMEIFPGIYWGKKDDEIETETEN